MLRLVAQGFAKFVTAEIALIEDFRSLHIGGALCAEPLKKKKRVDPQQEQNRIRRKAKRIEREIKRLSKQGKKLKPIEEIEGDRQLLKEEADRRRPQAALSETEIDNSALLLKDWSRYQADVAKIEIQKLRSALAAQERALRCLAQVSPHHLYKAAIQPVGSPTSSATSDDQGVELAPVSALQLSVNGPYATPPPRDPKAYDAPDGEIIDRTPTFEYDFEIDRKFMAEVKRAKFVKISGRKEVSS